ncbi:MAG: cob(I)yrinic acid a,c-diamide adenosyltransferase [Fimbriimonadaceae bacterium]
MKIYTKTGDDGTTGTLGQGRRLKSDLLIHVLGELDELNAAIGMGASPDRMVDFLMVQSRLLDIGAEVASLSLDKRFIFQNIDDDIDWLEQDIDLTDGNLTILENFILPGGPSQSAKMLHFARAVCRRAERSLVELRSLEPTIRIECVKYLNRLSDWLFVVARHCNELEGYGDTIWVKKND